MGIYIFSSACGSKRVAYATVPVCECGYFRRVCVLDNRWMARRAANLQIFMSGPASGRQRRQPMPQTTMWARDGWAAKRGAECEAGWWCFETLWPDKGRVGHTDPLAGNVETSSVVAVLALWQKCRQELTSWPLNYSGYWCAILNMCGCRWQCGCAGACACVCAGGSVCGVNYAQFKWHLMRI